MTLRTRLFVLVVLLLLPIVGIEVYDEMDVRARRAQEAKDQALRLVRVVANEQSRVVAGARQLLTALGMTPVVRSGDIAACGAFFAELVRFYPSYVSLVSIDQNGRLLCAGGAADSATYLGDRPYFRLAMETRRFAAGDYDMDGPAHRRAIYLAQPYYDSQGTISGVVAVGLSLDWLNGEIARSPLPLGATVSVVDRAGTILARHPERERFVGTRISATSHAYLLSGEEGVREARGFDGITRIFSYAPLPGGPAGLTVSVGVDKDELLKGTTAANLRDILVIAGSSILALLLAAIGARAFISRPIRMLLDAAEHWRHGDLDVRVTVPGTRSEFGRLGAAFNSMAAAIGVREQQLEYRVRERTKALQEAMRAQQTAEAALYEARKMETVGRLTGGVAHDFNNLLAAIVGNIELARGRLDPGHPGLPRLAEAIHSAKRGAGLVQHLLAFARRQDLHPEVVDLNSRIRGFQEMLQRVMPPPITIDLRLSPEVWLVRVDPDQLDAAVLHLAMNARDAMPNGGTLRIETKNATFTGQAGLMGDFVALIVWDTGTGIAPNILDRVFDPFFTTKGVGAGSGLGLSMVQGFVRQSSGSVFIESEAGRGTYVTLYLPRDGDAAARDRYPNETAILTFEPDPAIRPRWHSDCAE